MTQTRAPGQKTRTGGPTRLQLRGSITLTGRGAVVALFAACFLSLLIAAWTGWSVFADVMFVMTCGVVTCYTRASGLRAVVVCPPLAFFAGSVLAQLITASDTFSAAEGILVTLGNRRCGCSPARPWSSRSRSAAVTGPGGPRYRAQQPARGPEGHLAVTR